MYKIIQIKISGNYGSACKISDDIGDLRITNGWRSYFAFRRNV